jgi:hypothetical protein
MLTVTTRPKIIAWTSTPVEVSCFLAMEKMEVLDTLSSGV